MKRLKKAYKTERIDKDKLHQALHILKELKNPHYIDVENDVEGYFENMRVSDPEGYSFFVEDEKADGISETSDDSTEESEQTQADKDILEEQKIEREFNEKDPIQKNKFVNERQSIFVNDFPELDVSDKIDKTNEIKVSLAPGENQIPTNIVYEVGWEPKSFPGLFPDGRNDYHETRLVPISMQNYFEQRLLNYDRRFAQNTAYMFASFACQEKNVLERNVRVAQVRGTKHSKGGINPLNDPYRVLEACPGTPVFFKKKKQEFIARLENLGPFHLFFTLSCGEKRYSENFTPFFNQIHELKHLKFRYIIEDGREIVEVEHEQQWIELGDFLKDNYQSQHEFIKEHVLSQTLTFDHRVQEFIQTIMMSKSTGLPVKYYSYRVEFQLRGAAHIHGTIWVDFEKYFEHQIWEETGNKILDFKTTTSKKPDKVKEVVEENKLINVKNEEIINERNRRVKLMLHVFDQLRNQTFGTGEHSTQEMTDMLVDFSNRWICVSLKNSRTRQLCLDLQQHTCSKRYCLKCRTSCRFRYPRFPILETIIAVPVSIKYPDEEVCNEMVKLRTSILKSVRNILENEGKMENIINEVGKNELTEIIEVDENVCLLEDIIEFYTMKMGKVIKTEFSEKHKTKVCQLYEFIFGTVKTWPLTGFIRGIENTQNYLSIQDLKELLNVMKDIQESDNHSKRKKDIARERMELLLEVAEVPGKDFEEKYEAYKGALSITQRGYEIILTRDTDEIFINNYNPEYLRAWDANIDVQVTLDYFAVITYITDYKMKDESGTLEHIKAALKEGNADSLKEQLKHVAHTFMTHRKAGESEILYKLFSFLCFTNSNITATWMPTGFIDNMSRFLRAVSDEEAQHLENVVLHNGKLHQETFNLYDKFLQKPDNLPISYAQFVQRYKSGVDPRCENYSLTQEFFDYVPNIDFNQGPNVETHQTNNDFEEKTGGATCFTNSKDKKKLRSRKTALKNIPDDDFIFEHGSNEMKKRLPRYIPLKNSQWMQLRSKCVVRFHKINQTKDAHEFHFSEMQKYLPFQKEEELFPNNFDSCLKKYNESKDIIFYMKSKIFPHMENVQEGRKNAEIVDANIGTDLDPMGEAEDFLARDEGVTEDPDAQIFNPENCDAQDNLKFTSIGDRTFRKIEVQGDDTLLAKTRGLDPEQRAAVETVVEYARKLKMFEMRPNENIKPEPLRLLIHGNAGTGKSHIVDVIAQLAHKTFSFNASGNDPEHPYILKLAYTGTASDLVEGQTIHKALGLPCNNSAVPLGDKMRDMRRIQLKELKMIIVDEVSLVWADPLYQMHFRLSKEIRQNSLTFGGLPMVVVGDQLQIKPISSSFNFGIPSNPKFALADSLLRLWDEFERIELKTNHRSGQFKDYADVLNRLRVGQMTEYDIQKLESRVFPRHSTDLPADAIFVSGENKTVNEYNMKKTK